MTEQQLRRCIYCLEWKPIHEFNDEHVVQESMADFGEALTIDVVCIACNSWFGKTIDLVIARDSIEAMLRVWSGLHPADEFKSLGLNSTMRIEVDDPVFGTVLAQPRPLAEMRKVVIDPLPHVVFAHPAQADAKMYPANKLPTVADLAAAGYPVDSQLQLRIGGNNPERTVAELQAKGFGQIELTEFVPLVGTVKNFEMVFRFGHEQMRAVAKVAFNYLAHERGAEYVLQAQFNAVRQYVRYDVRPPKYIVRPNPTPIVLTDVDPVENPIHLVAVGTVGSGNVIATVSLFSQVAYGVLLATSDSFIVAHEFRHGHVYNLRERKVRRKTE